VLTRTAISRLTTSPNSGVPSTAGTVGSSSVTLHARTRRQVNGCSEGGRASELAAGAHAHATALHGAITLQHSIRGCRLCSLSLGGYRPSAPCSATVPLRNAKVRKHQLEVQRAAALVGLPPVHQQEVGGFHIPAAAGWRGVKPRASSPQQQPARLPARPSACLPARPPALQADSANTQDAPPRHAASAAPLAPALTGGCSPPCAGATGTAPSGARLSARWRGPCSRPAAAPRTCPSCRGGTAA